MTPSSGKASELSSMPPPVRGWMRPSVRASGECCGLCWSATDVSLFDGLRPQAASATSKSATMTRLGLLSTAERVFGSFRVRPLWPNARHMSVPSPYGDVLVGSSPTVVEAEGYAFLIRPVGKGFVAEPAFPHQDRSRLWAKVDEALL